MADDAANLMNLDLNLGPFVEPEESLSNGLVSLEEFIGSINGLRENIREREIQPLRRSNGADRLREIIRQREVQSIGRSDSFNQLRERLRNQDIQHLRQSDGLDRIRDILTARDRRRSIWRRATVAPEIARNIASDLIINHPVIDPSSSVTPAERDNELSKLTENNNEINAENEESDEKGNEDKGIDDEKGSFFDCNICLDLAKDPVVTCCGHLFCWPCIYQWLNLHSVTNECPVCKGEVTIKNVIPIYGRGDNIYNNNDSCGSEQDPPGPKIPIRPHARRVESVRQSIIRDSVSIPMDEFIRRLSERTGSSERIVSYFMGRNREEQPPPLDDRDSVSSIAAVIQAESQTIDTVLEIDSNVSLSTSTSRRRNGNDASRADVDSGDSRAHRRRRMN